MPTDNVELEAVMAGYRSAVLAKDIETFMALYDTDVEVFDAWGTWSYRGAAAWRGMAVAWFASLGDGRVEVDAAEIRSERSGDLGLLHAAVTYRPLSPDGKRLNGMPNRLTWALRRHADRWRIIHEHTSVPVDFDSMKGILTR